MFLTLLSIQQVYIYNAQLMNEVKLCAQTIVGGYYTLINKSLPHIVIAITNILVTHYFHLILNPGPQVKIEVKWHYLSKIRYPPEE